MSILLWITIEMEYIITCLKFILFFTNGRQKFDPERVNEVTQKSLAKQKNKCCCVVTVNMQLLLFSELK